MRTASAENIFIDALRKQMHQQISIILFKFLLMLIIACHSNGESTTADISLVTVQANNLTVTPKNDSLENKTDNSITPATINEALLSGSNGVETLDVQISTDFSSTKTAIEENSSEILGTDATNTGTELMRTKASDIDEISTKDYTTINAVSVESITEIKDELTLFATDEVLTESSRDSSASSAFMQSLSDHTPNTITNGEGISEQLTAELQTATNEGMTLEDKSTTEMYSSASAEYITTVAITTEDISQSSISGGIPVETVTPSFAMISGSLEEVTTWYSVPASSNVDISRDYTTHMPTNEQHFASLESTDKVITEPTISPGNTLETAITDNIEQTMASQQSIASEKISDGISDQTMTSITNVEIQQRTTSISAEASDLTNQSVQNSEGTPALITKNEIAEHSAVSATFDDETMESTTVSVTNESIFTDFMTSIINRQMENTAPSKSEEEISTEYTYYTVVSSTSEESLGHKTITSLNGSPVIGMVSSTNGVLSTEYSTASITNEEVEDSSESITFEKRTEHTQAAATDFEVLTKTMNSVTSEQIEHTIDSTSNIRVFSESMNSDISEKMQHTMDLTTNLGISKKHAMFTDSSEDTTEHSKPLVFVTQFSSESAEMTSTSIILEEFTPSSVTNDETEFTSELKGTEQTASATINKEISEDIMISTTNADHTATFSTAKDTLAYSPEQATVTAKDMVTLEETEGIETLATEATATLTAEVLPITATTIDKAERTTEEGITKLETNSDMTTMSTIDVITVVTTNEMVAAATTEEKATLSSEEITPFATSEEILTSTTQEMFTAREEISTFSAESMTKLMSEELTGITNEAVTTSSNAYAITTGSHELTTNAASGPNIVTSVVNEITSTFDTDVRTITSENEVLTSRTTDIMSIAHASTDVEVMNSVRATGTFTSEAEAITMSPEGKPTIVTLANEVISSIDLDSVSSTSASATVREVSVDLHLGTEILNNTEDFFQKTTPRVSRFASVELTNSETEVSPQTTNITVPEELKTNIQTTRVSPIISEITSTISEITTPTISEISTPTISEITPTISEITTPPTISEISTHTISEIITPTISEISTPTISEITAPTISEITTPTILEVTTLTIFETTSPIVSGTISPVISETISPQVSVSSDIFSRNLYVTENTSTSEIIPNANSNATGLIHTLPISTEKARIPTEITSTKLSLSYSFSAGTSTKASTVLSSTDIDTFPVSSTLFTTTKTNEPVTSSNSSISSHNSSSALSSSVIISSLLTTPEPFVVTSSLLPQPVTSNTSISVSQTPVTNTPEQVTSNTSHSSHTPVSQATVTGTVFIQEHVTNISSHATVSQRIVTEVTATPEHVTSNSFHASLTPIFVKGSTIAPEQVTSNSTLVIFLVSFRILDRPFTADLEQTDSQSYGELSLLVINAIITSDEMKNLNLKNVRSIRFRQGSIRVSMVLEFEDQTSAEQVDENLRNLFWKPRFPFFVDRASIQVEELLEAPENPDGYSGILVITSVVMVAIAGVILVITGLNAQNSTKRQPLLAPLWLNQQRRMRYHPFLNTSSSSRMAPDIVSYNHKGFSTPGAYSYAVANELSNARPYSTYPGNIGGAQINGKRLWLSNRTLPYGVYLPPGYEMHSLRRSRDVLKPNRFRHVKTPLQARQQLLIPRQQQHDELQHQRQQRKQPQKALLPYQLWLEQQKQRSQSQTQKATLLKPYKLWLYQQKQLQLQKQAHDIQGKKLNRSEINSRGRPQKVSNVRPQKVSRPEVAANVFSRPQLNPNLRVREYCPGGMYRGGRSDIIRIPGYPSRGNVYVKEGFDVYSPTR